MSILHPPQDALKDPREGFRIAQAAHPFANFFFLGGGEGRAAKKTMRAENNPAPPNLDRLANSDRAALFFCQHPLSLTAELGTFGIF